MYNQAKEMDHRRTPDARLVFVSIVFVATAIWFYLEGIIFPDTIFFIIASILVFIVSFWF